MKNENLQLVDNSRPPSRTAPTWRCKLDDHCSVKASMRRGGSSVSEIHKFQFRQQAHCLRLLAFEGGHCHPGWQKARGTQCLGSPFCSHLVQIGCVALAVAGRVM